MSLSKKPPKKRLSKFTITITDINGSRHFYLSQIIKKVVLYTLLFILAFMIFAAFYIRYLDTQISSLDAKRDELIEKGKELEFLNSTMQKSIQQKSEQYAAIEDKIALFEEQLGLDSENNLTLNARLDKLSLTNEQQTQILLQIPNGYPIKNTALASSFGWRTHPITKRQEFHTGIDLRADIGTPVYAPANGVVEFSGYNNGGYGQMVVLLHNFGFKTVFAHLMRREVVSAGDVVSKNQLIGYTGNTGASTGPHLHYEVRFINKPLEPSYFLGLERKNLNNFFNQERRIPWQSLVKAITAQTTQKPQ